jgi:exodeoxyribonuclease-3
MSAATANLAPNLPAADYNRRIQPMRIATWNVNSLKARLEKVAWWIDRARPDVLLLQETKLADVSAPHEAFQKLGYLLAHHGSGGRNGVAIASRFPILDLETNFGDTGADADAGLGLSDDDPFGEPRILAGRCNGIRVASLYVPNGRAVGSPFYAAKLAWLERLARWVAAEAPAEALVLGGDFNVAPTDLDVWDPKACHGGTHVSKPERAEFEKLLALGLVDAYRKHHTEGDRYTWWDYRAGDFHRNIGMRIDHLLVSAPVAARTVGAEIDREARKGKPIPSDHAPLVVDLDEPGHAFDASWTRAAERIAGRRAKKA